MIDLIQGVALFLLAGLVFWLTVLVSQLKNSVDRLQHQQWREGGWQ